MRGVEHVDESALLQVRLFWDFLRTKAKALLAAAASAPDQTKRAELLSAASTLKADIGSELPEEIKRDLDDALSIFGDGITTAMALAFLLGGATAAGSRLQLHGP